MDAAAPTAVRPSSRWRAGMLALLVVLVAGELGARALDARFDPPLAFHSQEADLKVAQMDDLARSGGADVVFVGTSQVAWGIAPQVVESGVDGVVAYNAALGGAVPAITETWTLDVVLPRLRPAVVVVGVSSLDLQDSPEARELTALFDASAGVRQATGAESALERVDRWMADRSVLWSHRSSLRDPRAWKEAVDGGPQLPPFVASIDRRGRNTIGQDLAFRERPLTGPGVHHWKLGSENRDALSRLLQGVRDSGAEAVVVNMPVTDVFIEQHPNGAADYAAYRTTLTELAAGAGATVLDYDHRDLRSFGDAIHLNGVGSAAFSRRLATDLRSLVPVLGAPPVRGVEDGAVPDAATPDPTVPAVPEVEADHPGAADVAAPDEVPALAPPPSVAPPVTVPPLGDPVLPPTTIPELPEVPDPPEVPEPPGVPDVPDPPVPTPTTPTGVGGG